MSSDDSSSDDSSSDINSEYDEDSETDECLSKMCDACRIYAPLKPGEFRRLGAMVTIADAGRLRGYRPQAKRALKVYNKSNSKRFKLKNIYKVNYVGDRYQYMTFSAQEGGSLEPTLFRGVVHGDYRVLFCEVKEDDEITLSSYIIDGLRSTLRLRRIVRFWWGKTLLGCLF